MKIVLSSVAVALGGFLFTGGPVQAAAPVVTAKADPYQTIWERNVFGLKPPPPPPPAPIPPPPPVNFKLSGISNFKAKKALLIFQEGNGKPEYMSLAVGERSGPVEVLDIDAKNGVVQVRNGGNEILLTFEKDGLKAPAGPAPGQPGGPPAPGAPGAPPGGVNAIPNIIRPGASASAIPAPGGAPGAGSPGGMIFPNQPGRQTPAGSSPQLPTRSIRVPTTGSPQSGNFQYGPAVPANPPVYEHPADPVIEFALKQETTPGGPPKIPLELLDPDANPDSGPPTPGGK
ncbi:MAG: hypothetical protein HZA89_10485 [Verrucomicrobia bacterium]|nr:hypothetical protein [Verrucomicrobiota bacterium]